MLIEIRWKRLDSDTAFCHSQKTVLKKNNRNSGHCQGVMDIKPGKKGQCILKNAKLSRVSIGRWVFFAVVILTKDRKEIKKRKAAGKSSKSDKWVEGANSQHKARKYLKYCLNCQDTCMRIL